MIDDVFPLDILEEYIPLRFRTPADSEYFEYLVRSLEHNYYSEYYNFALLPLHLIYMGIVYHYIYGIYKADINRFKCVLIGFENSLRDNVKIEDLSWQTFSNINERSIFKFYNAIGVSKDQIGKLRKPVDTRNSCSHANGVIISSYEEFDKHVELYLENLNLINEFCEKEFQTLFLRFINEIKIDIEEIEEAKQYLEDDFFPLYGINIAIVNSLARIPDETYPDDKKIFFTAIHQIGSWYSIYNKETRY